MSKWWLCYHRSFVPTVFSAPISISLWTHSYVWVVLRSGVRFFKKDLILTLQAHPSNFYKVVSLLGPSHLFLTALISSSLLWHSHFLWELKVKNVLHWYSLFNYHLLGNWKRASPHSVTPWRITRVLLAWPKKFCFITFKAFWFLMIFKFNVLFLFPWWDRDIVFDVKF